MGKTELKTPLNPAPKEELQLQLPPLTLPPKEDFTLSLEPLNERELKQLPAGDLVQLAQAHRKKGAPTATHTRSNVTVQSHDKAVIKHGGKELVIYSWSGGGFRYQKSGDPTVYFQPFSSRKDFGRKMGKLLTETFGKDRPAMPASVAKVYRDLKLTPGNAGPAYSPQADPLPVVDTGSFQPTSEGAGVFFIGEDRVYIEKRDHGVRLSVRAKGSTKSENSSFIQFNGKEEFTKAASEWVAGLFETEQKSIAPQLSEAWSTLGIQTALRIALKRTQDRVPVQSNQLISTMGFGRYDLESDIPPMTYASVRNLATSNNYCLAFTQNTFDQIFGIGKARQVGLEGDNARWAQALDLTNNPNFKVEKYDRSKHEDIPVGTIVRFSRPRTLLDRIPSSIPFIGRQQPATDSETAQTHVGISLGRGKVAHLIGSSVYIEPISTIHVPYRPTEVAYVTGLKPRNMTVEQFPLNFDGGAKLPDIAKAVIQSSNVLKNHNIIAVEEMIYQLNRDKFVVQTDRWALPSNRAWAELKNSSPLMIPTEWNARPR